MLHPSYSDLINVVNSGVEKGERPVVQSRYSIVLATARRARQLVAGEEPLIPAAPGRKALSVAVEELYEGKIRILSESDDGQDVFLESDTSGFGDADANTAEAEDDLF